MNAENLRQTESVDLGSPTAALTLALLFANCDIKVKKLTLINTQAIAASTSNYASVSLKNGATVLATVDSQTGLTAFSGKMIPVPTASQTVVAGSTLSVAYTPVGTQASAALASCRVQVEYVRAQNK